MSSNNSTTALDPTSTYGYIPTQSVCYIFVVLFAVSTVLHLGQSIRYRAWWLIPTAVLAGAGEVIGWGGRLWSSYSPLNDNPYLMQIVCTIIAPTPLVGAIFITFGRFSAVAGQQYSRLSAGAYSKVFLTCDIVSLFVQSVGGGLAASSNSQSTSNLGSNIMLAGIVLQLVSLTIFSILGAEYLFRYFNGRPARPLALGSVSAESVMAPVDTLSEPMGKSLKLLLVGICLETVFLYIRAVYRTIELADGFTGSIIRTQVWFNVFDGMMVVLATYTLNALHPVRLLKAAAAERWSTSVPLAFKDQSSV